MGAQRPLCPDKCRLGTAWRVQAASEWTHPVRLEAPVWISLTIRSGRHPGDRHRDLCYQQEWGKMAEVFNTLRPRQNGRHFADDLFKCIFLNENVWIPIEISLKFVPKGSFNNNPALFQIMAWRRPGDKPLSEPMLVSSYMRHSASMS